jgi:hypothetical protein
MVGVVAAGDLLRVDPAGWDPVRDPVDHVTRPAAPEFKESSQHRVDRGAVTYEIGEGEAAEAGVAGVAAGSA